MSTTSERPEVAHDKYEEMMRLADLYDSAGDEMRERAQLGAAVLADEAVADSADLARATYLRAEDDILAATTGRNGLMVRSVELDADALVVRATVLTYRWIDDLQVAAYRTLGSIAARAVGYLAPEVALGGAIVSAGLIETGALDRDGLAAYLNELAEANPDLMDHFVSGGGGLLDALQMRALLTAAVLGGSSAAAATRGGLRAVGAPELAPELAVDFSAALRDVAAGFVVDEPSGPVAATAEGTAPRTLEDLMTSLSQVEGELLVQRLGEGRFIGYLPSPATRSEGLRLVGGDNRARAASVVAALETAIGDEPGARVLLVGHARGGMTAAEIAASAASDRFTIDQVITAGSPSAQVPRVPGPTTVLALEDRTDPVALLGSLINAGVPNRLTVVFDGGDGRGAAAYVAGGRAVDAADHPELRAAIRRIQELGYLSA
ncbi:hypothetical protein EKO23_06285 [Nocardioides guangzhouensis]|uniref:Alpha/beta hydrolase n=1 Tax=Nocardioides guangzhouensis TaxID=2497878 RepID=A0A4Q4ZIM0_9ACTN|nr:hypothetical protein [Nocardioides guangzhouensis]RYP87214.1 hypothetical protein EKO23_06285 [Nocardioides guangzhouensis]